MNSSYEISSGYKDSFYIGNKIRKKFQSSFWSQKKKISPREQTNIFDAPAWISSGTELSKFEMEMTALETVEDKEN